LVSFDSSFAATAAIGVRLSDPTRGLPAREGSSDHPRDSSIAQLLSALAFVPFVPADTYSRKLSNVDFTYAQGLMIIKRAGKNELAKARRSK